MSQGNLKTCQQCRSVVSGADMPEEQTGLSCCVTLTPPHSTGLESVSTCAFHLLSEPSRYMLGLIPGGFSLGSQICRSQESYISKVSSPHHQDCLQLAPTMQTVDQGFVLVRFKITSEVSTENYPRLLFGVPHDLHDSRLPADQWTLTWVRTCPAGRIRKKVIVRNVSLHRKFLLLLLCWLTAY
uniref:Uncharacterized protein n=1 Tax=Branchiostoma floridae TaxID=7739 RepID=C3YJ34_BRAFL|eukprot:XP_002603685.1 hypothetical protein BRAFLDRAFT_98634 [Branchiostoma floridae]